FQFDDSSFDKTLFFLGGIIFSIFGKVSLSSCFRYGGNNSRALNCFQFMQFFAQLLGTSVGNWYGIHLLDTLFYSKCLTKPADMAIHKLPGAIYNHSHCLYVVTT